MKKILKQIFYEAQFNPLLHLIPDELYLKIHTKITFGYWPNLNEPKLFNEKIHWLKLHNRNPEYIKYVDKYEVKRIVSEKIGSQYIVPTLGIWNTFDEIDFSSLPNQFVLKCTHDSGSVVIVKNKNNFDKKSARKKIKKAMSHNYFWLGREWAYKNVKPRIIAEKFISDFESEDLKDYKFFCFDGKVKLIQVDYDRFIEHKRNLYTPEWECIDAFIEYPSHPEIKIPKPDKLNQMISIAEKLSENIAFVRIDLYNPHDKIYFGEMTFYHEAGFGLIRPKEFELKLGEYITCVQ